MPSLRRLEMRSFRVDRRRFGVEVYEHPEQLDCLRALTSQGSITLVYSAYDDVHNDAVALKNVLWGRRTKRKPKMA